MADSTPMVQVKSLHELHWTTLTDNERESAEGQWHHSPIASCRRRPIAAPGTGVDSGQHLPDYQDLQKTEGGRSHPQDESEPAREEPLWLRILRLLSSEALYTPLSFSSSARWQATQ
jgi:hypothetical protein